MRTALICLAVGAAALGGCSKKPGDTAAASTAAAAPAASAAAPAAAGPAGPITLAELPAPKAGLWERASSQDGAPPQTDTKCLSGKPIDPTEGGPPCATLTATRTATGGFVVDGDCPNNGVSAKLRLAGEGDFATRYTTDATMSMTGGPGGAMTLKNHSVWTYKGACPADAKG